MYADEVSGFFENLWLAVVLNGIAAVAAMAEMALKLYRETGVAVSRHGTFAKAPPEAIEGFLASLNAWPTPSCGSQESEPGVSPKTRCRGIRYTGSKRHVVIVATSLD